MTFVVSFNKLINTKQKTCLKIKEIAIPLVTINFFESPAALRAKVILRLKNTPNFQHWTKLLLAFKLMNTEKDQNLLLLILTSMPQSIVLIA